MNYLFLFTISPVQSFISQARKTSDLYAGSKLLSDLIDFAIENLPEKDSCIFPAYDVPSKPNRFIAIIKNYDDKKIYELGKNIENKVKEFLLNKANQLFNKVCKDKPKPQYFDQQIQNFLEINWVAQNFEENNYSDIFNKIENALGSIKNFRAFTLSEEAGARKCSLCGERNALICNSKKTYNQESIIELGDNSKYSFYLTRDEGLCAVCFTKRFYELNEAFPSTAEISISATLNKLKGDISKDGFAIISNYENLIGENGDYQLYFKENLNSKYLDKQGLSSFSKKLPEITKALEKIESKLKELNLKFSPYYALAMFDADSMGEMLAGKNLKAGVNLEVFHRMLSKKLGEFGKWLEDYFNKKENQFKGKVVYAGGDDFLLFLNLNYLITELKTIYENFDRIINSGEIEQSSKKKVTFSGGIVIAHYKHPLSDVLINARNTEKIAKSYDLINKNRFALSILKHSGEREQVVFRWVYDNKFVFSSILKISEFLKKGVFSKTFINNLEKEFYPLLIDGYYNEEPILNTEMKRLVSKAHKIVVKKEEKERNINLMLENLELLLSENAGNLDNFLSSLRIAEFIARHLNGGPNENSY